MAVLVSVKMKPSGGELGLHMIGGRAKIPDWLCPYLFGTLKCIGSCSLAVSYSSYTHDLTIKYI